MSAVLKVRRSMGDPFELRIQDRTSHNRTQQWHSVSIDGGLKEGWSGVGRSVGDGVALEPFAVHPLRGIREASRGPFGDTAAFLGSRVLLWGLTNHRPCRRSLRATASVPPDAMGRAARTSRPSANN